MSSSHEFLEYRLREGRPLPTGVNDISYLCTAEPYAILKVKNALLASVAQPEVLNFQSCYTLCD